MTMLLTSILHKNVSTKLHRKPWCLSRKVFGGNYRTDGWVQIILLRRFARLLAQRNKTRAPEEDNPLLQEHFFFSCDYKCMHGSVRARHNLWSFIMLKTRSFPIRSVLKKPSTFWCEFVLMQKNHCHTFSAFFFSARFLCKTFWLIFLQT